jgi:hypothetical protein
MSTEYKIEPASDGQFTVIEPGQRMSGVYPTKEAAEEDLASCLKEDVVRQTASTSQHDLPEKSRTDIEVNRNEVDGVKFQPHNYQKGKYLTAAASPHVWCFSQRASFYRYIRTAFRMFAAFFPSKIAARSRQFASV